MIKQLATATTAAALLTAIAAPLNAGAPQTAVKLLTANFEARQVVQIEVGDFHFLPGQIAPIHTHAAPAVGYIAKGSILYQVEGEPPRLLREGDAFYEPAGPRILRFDNASATQEAIFLDFNLQQAGEPFIVFEQPPTEAIDRRPLPTIDLAGASVDQVDIYASELPRGTTTQLDAGMPTLGLVAEGVVELRITGQPARRLVAGESFALENGEFRATIVNLSPDVPATVITFRLS